ncbi:MAG: hypothetical protein ACUVTB_06190 [Candidatus Bathycorpusculaceae bacterium]
MISNRNKFLILILITASTLIQTAKATSTNFTVNANEEVTKTLRLKIEDHVLIHFTVVGGENAIHFVLAYPNGTEKDFGNRGYFHYTFICDAEGDYILRFSNQDSTDKLLTLDYEIEHYIFGIPQMLFLTIIIAVILVIAVASFIFLSKTH